MFGAPPDKKMSAACHLGDLVVQIHDNYHIARQDLKIARDRMKARYEQLSTLADYQEGNKLFPYRPTRKKRKSNKLQTFLLDTYNIFTRINEVVYRIQRLSRANLWSSICTGWRHTWVLLGSNSHEEVAVCRIGNNLQR
jgi:hypothetical protein